MSFQKGLICIMTCDDGYKHATVTINSVFGPKSKGVTFNVYAKNLSEGFKGFHVHETGNLEKGCETLGPHYNPTNKLHGKLNDVNAHLGDLGNIYVNPSGHCDQKIHSQLLTLEELVGRSLVIHEKQDDLGRGGDKQSMITGNSGRRVCCGVIGYR